LASDLLLQACPNEEPAEYEYDIHLQGLMDFNAVNEFKYEQKEKPAVVFLDADGEFLDYRSMRAGAQMKIIASIELWCVTGSKWTVRIVMKSVTMLENGGDDYVSKKSPPAAPKRKVEEVLVEEESVVIMPKKRKD
jgi:hypothetical protein